MTDENNTVPLFEPWYNPIIDALDDTTNFIDAATSPFGEFLMALSGMIAPPLFESNMRWRSRVRYETLAYLDALISRGVSADAALAFLSEHEVKHLEIDISGMLDVIAKHPSLLSRISVIASEIFAEPEPEAKVKPDTAENEPQE